MDYTLFIIVVLIISAMVFVWFYINTILDSEIDAMIIEDLSEAFEEIEELKAEQQKTFEEELTLVLEDKLDSEGKYVIRHSLQDSKLIYVLYYRYITGTLSYISEYSLGSFNTLEEAKEAAAHYSKEDIHLKGI
jgi:hypothetical protein